MSKQQTSREKLKSALLKNAVQKIRSGKNCGCHKTKPNIQKPRKRD